MTVDWTKWLRGQSTVEQNELDVFDEYRYPLVDYTVDFFASPGVDILKFAKERGSMAEISSRSMRLVNRDPVLDNVLRMLLYKPQCDVPVTVISHSLSAGDIIHNIDVDDRKSVYWVPGHYVGNNIESIVNSNDDMLGNLTYGPVLQNRWLGSRCDVMIIGKMPGIVEVRRNCNFCGPTGNLLWTTFCKFVDNPDKLSSWYVTNVVKYIPPIPSSGKLDSISVMNCRLLLQQEICLLLPRYILLLGQDAIDKFLNAMGYKQKLWTMQDFKSSCKNLTVTLPTIDDHGNTVSIEHTMTIFAVVHPAAVLRNNYYLSEFEGGIGRFVDLLRGTNVDLRLPDIRVQRIYDSQTLEKVCRNILDQGPSPIALDSEWHGRAYDFPDAYLRTIQFTNNSKEAYILVLRSAGGYPTQPEYEMNRIRSVWRWFLSELLRYNESHPSGPHYRLVVHNGKADWSWITSWDRESGDLFYRLMKQPDSPEATKYSGGFDTMIAAHVLDEAQPGGYGLDNLALRYLHWPSWSTSLDKWVKDYCRSHGISRSELSGYGDCPDNILLGDENHPSYAAYDVVSLIELYNKFQNMLDKAPVPVVDVDFPNSVNCRPIFWSSMKAFLAYYEMEYYGVGIDRQILQRLASTYTKHAQLLVQDLRKMIHWSDFNFKSVYHVRMLLFGNKYAKKIPTSGGGHEIVDGKITARLLNLEPVYTTGSKKLWSELSEQEKQYSLPSTDQHVLITLLSRQNLSKYQREVVTRLLCLRRLNQLIQTVLPSSNGDSSTDDSNDNSESADGGILTYVSPITSRVHSHFYPTKETGRCSSARPNLQNLSKSKEDYYKDILRDEYVCPVRSIVTADPGWKIVEVDLVAAELMMVAVQSRCHKLLQDCLKSVLPDNDPNKSDIHSSIAVMAFDLRLSNDNYQMFLQELGEEEIRRRNVSIGDPIPPLKHWVAVFGPLRHIAKTVIFGLLYGRGVDSIVRTITEECIGISPEVAEQRAIAIRQTIYSRYPELFDFQQETALRVLRCGWLANWGKRYRRFPLSRWSNKFRKYINFSKDPREIFNILNNNSFVDPIDRDVLFKYMREAVNFRIQGGVAYLIDLAMQRFINHPRRFLDNNPSCSVVSRDGLNYIPIINMHDALVFEVRDDFVEEFVGDIYQSRGIIYDCICDIPVYAVDLDGNIYSDFGPVKFFVDISVSQRWGG